MTKLKPPFELPEQFKLKSGGVQHTWAPVAVSAQYADCRSAGGQPDFTIEHEV
jgi:hypothetical protein